MRWQPAVVALALAACAAPPPGPAAPVSPAEISLAPYRAALGTNAVYRVDPLQSRADVVVRRAGSLQRLGHDHVITFRSITGLVLIDERGGGGSRADLSVDLRNLAVDETAARAVFGLDTNPSESDIEGTAKNLHEKVLDTANWPLARISIVAAEAGSNPLHGEVTLQLKDSSFALPVDALLNHDGAELYARCVFDLNQSDLGLEPFSLLGGALSVSDRVEISFRIRAHRTDRIEEPAPR